MSNLPRLTYLASRIGRDCNRVPREIRRLVPHYELYEQVAEHGSDAAAVALEIPKDQINNLIKSGKAGGKGSLQEFRLLIADEVMKNPSLEDTALNKRLDTISLLNRYVNNSAEQIIQTSEAKLNTTARPQEIPKWNTGFTPLDLCVTGGVYQGVLMFMAKPGEGKTSTMLATMESIKRSHPTWQMLFFEQEIPLNMMLARMRPILDRTTFDEFDEIICGQLSIEEIIKRLEKPPVRRDRVVFIDSPDAMPGLGTTDTTRELGHIFRQLVRIKEGAELVVVSTQPNRRDSGALTKSSPANSWEKVWYVDMMCSVAKTGHNHLMMKSLKNRFGMEGTEISYQFDLADFSWDPNLLQEEDDWSTSAEEEEDGI